MPDDDDRPRDASSAADPGWSDAAHAAAAWSEAVAPDDIRDLAHDISAYHRELRAERRHELTGLLYGRRGVRLAALAAAALAIAALVAAALGVITPSAGRPAPLPIATTTGAVGQPGSLLPNVALRDLTGTTIAAQTLRPGFLALIPLNCGCQPLLNTLGDDASAKALAPLDVIAPTAADAEATALGGRIDHGTVYYDGAGQLAHDFGASGVTVVLVKADGTVFRVQRNVTTATAGQLVPVLSLMLQRTSN